MDEQTTVDVAERIDRALPGWRANGLDERYDDLLTRENAIGHDASEMETGAHYDYKTQRWVEGHDHGHLDVMELLPLIFCGSDLATCLGTS